MPKVKPLNRKGSPIGTILYIKQSLSKEEEGQYNILHYLNDPKGMAREMLDNESHRGTRKYYHEIVAFHPKDKEHCNPEFMKEFVEEYIKHYYADNKVYWGVHRDKEHPHLHICFSATKLDGVKMQFRGKDLAEKDRYVQKYCKEKGLNYLPELEFKKNANKDLEKQIKNRKSVSDKEHCKKTVDEFIKKMRVADKESFLKALKKQNMALSKRCTGVVYQGRTYRFKTLGFDNDLYRNDLYVTPEQKIFKEMEDSSNKNRLKKDLDKDKGLGYGMGR